MKDKQRAKKTKLSLNCFQDHDFHIFLKSLFLLPPLGLLLMQFFASKSQTWFEQVFKKGFMAFLAS